MAVTVTRPMAGNPNTYKNAQNKRNMSSIFDAAGLDDGNERNSEKILHMYQRIKNAKTKTARTHKNQESTQIDSAVAKRAAVVRANVTSGEFRMTDLPGAASGFHQGLLTERASQPKQQQSFGRPMGVESRSRPSSVNRNEFTSHLSQPRGSGACKESTNAFQSQFQLA